ncbi:MAG: transposase [Bacteroidetes bacterium]|nr:transposase [Bacteroidota bacterium]
MPYRKPAYKNHYYHVYNRGNNYEPIFYNQQNYHFFLRRLLLYFENKINLVAYCLMPNHYHLLLEILEDDFLQKAMQKFSTSYTKAINKEQNRVGHLFQGRYKSKLVPDNNYLLHLSRYIHLNPVKAGLVQNPQDWFFSSYLDFINIRKSEFLNLEIISSQIQDYRYFVMSFQEEQNYYLKDLLFD